MHRLVIFCMCLPSALALTDPIRISTGLISGVQGADAGTRVYKAIPYAAAPTGQLRWAAPKPALAWAGTRKADQFSPVCEQAPYPAASIYYSDPAPMSEDCLYLNVWTAAKSSTERRPVMLWIHGGALTRGAGSTPAYDGEALAGKGVVLVTINYRLGIFGFLAHPELTKESDRKASGNYAILDQIAALEWVQKNIQAFGGDPKRITIFGESAGSWSVNYLMATPLARGLFQRAIGESGGAFGTMRTLAEAEEIGAKFGTIQALREKSAEDLMKASATASFPPNVDGWLLPTDVRTIFAQGKQNDVALLAGSNADEGKSLSPWPANGKAQDYIDQIHRLFGAKADEVLKLYPAATDEQAKESHFASYRDLSFAWQMRTWVRLQTKTGSSEAYLYYFNRVPPGPQSNRYGAYHAAEIAYVFNNLTGKRPWEETDRKLSDAMSSYWVNFAAEGDPNGKGLPTWPAYKSDEDAAIEFGDTIQTVHGMRAAALDFFDRWANR